MNRYFNCLLLLVAANLLLSDLAVNVNMLVKTNNLFNAEIYVPRPEYPRPNFIRSPWLSLNGFWYFQIDPENRGLNDEWYLQGRVNQQHILVPFPWQSKLAFNASSNYSNLVNYRGVAWYQREFVVPVEWAGKRVILNFAGVDYHAMVWVNEKYVGEHFGGYTCFSFDITDHVKIGAANTVTVRVYDPPDTSEIPCGKQRSLYQPVWENVKFTSSSGIWRTVWIEARSLSHIVDFYIIPNVDESTVQFKINISLISTSTLTLKVFDPFNKLVAIKHLSILPGEKSVETSMHIDEPLLWSPENPHLYNVSITLIDGSGNIDEVWTYFGMRKISAGKGKIYLNNKPIYLMGALVQGYNPSGIYTSPTDEYIKRDIETAKNLGFNILRMHVKIEDPRFYYWADKLGMLIWQDIPNIERFTPISRANFERELKEIILQLRNHPSIIAWCIFNEEWGLSEGKMSDEIAASSQIRDFVKKMTHLVRQLDPHRLIVDNSPAWSQSHSHMETDICDYHPYASNIATWREMLEEIIKNTYNGSTFNFAPGYSYAGQPVIISECGIEGINGFRWTINELRKYQEIVGYIYTELYDVEHEYAGLMTYNRVLKRGDYNITKVNTLDYLAVDSEYLKASIFPRVITQTNFTINVYFSHYGSEEERGYLCWKLDGADVENKKPVNFTPYKVNTYILSFPAPQSLVKLRIWIEDERGCVLAEQTAYINVTVENVEKEIVDSSSYFAYIVCAVIILVVAYISYRAFQYKRFKK
ncbi:MAG: glycoside hydrolase family 2 TIM barrel-domain containing protein [Candidatus Bathyarchaeia archaeon]